MNIYTPYYCEENIYLLAKQLINQPAPEKTVYQPFVVFITNPFKQTHVRYQKAGNPKQQHLVIWDYHVILILKITKQEVVDGKLKINQQSEVYDYDTNLGFKTQFEEYYEKALGFAKQSPMLKSWFRVVNAQEFCLNFASDRSHMLKSSEKKGGKTQYLQTPPEYDAIRGEKADCAMNLMQFLDTNIADKKYGQWMSEEQLNAYFRQKCV